MFLKEPVIIIIRFDENNVVEQIYIDMYKFQGEHMVYLTFLIYYS